MKAIWNDTIIAESDDIVEVEGNPYFPLASLDRAHVEPSETRTHCGWKGDAAYFTIMVGEARNPDAAWTYPTPMKGAEMVADRVAFWRGVRIEP